MEASFVFLAVTAILLYEPFQNGVDLLFDNYLDHLEYCYCYRCIHDHNPDSDNDEDDEDDCN